MVKNKNDKRYKNIEKQLKLVLGEKTKEGFVGLTVTEICQRAKIKRSTFYRHYSSLEDVMRSIRGVLEDDFERIIKSNEQIFGIFYDLLRYIHDEKIAFWAVGNYQRLFQEILSELRPFITKNWNKYRDDLSEQMFLACRGALVEVISYWFENCDANTSEIRKYANILLHFTEEFGHFAKYFDN